MSDNKTGPMLREWLERLIGPYVSKGARAFAHGGTCLTLHGIKDTTKDVDFAFPQRADFEQVRAALQKAHYNETACFQQFGEIQVRLEHPSETIDIVDLRCPTWNHWTMKGSALQGCTRIRHGNLELLQPDVETMFVFKTYPCRPSDLQDLKRILEKAALRWNRVKTMFAEQEAYARGQNQYAPGLLIAHIRGRAHASLGTLGEAGIPGIGDIAEWAEQQWLALRMPAMTSAQLLAHIRTDEDAWMRYLHQHAEHLESWASGT